LSALNINAEGIANVGEIEPTPTMTGDPAVVAAHEARRRGLALVAVDDTCEIRVVLAAFAELGLAPELLVTLESEGVLRLTDDRVEFVDPQHRSAAIAATAQERRALHAAAAHALTEPRHSAQRAEHLAAAAVGPDEEAAAALAELGNVASLKGEAALSGELYMRAGGLSPDPEDRARRLYRAGDGYWNAGQYPAARAAFDAAYLGSAEPLLRADTALQLGQLDMYQRGSRYSRDLFVAASSAVEPYDIDRAAMLLVHAASTVTLSCDVVGAVALAQRATALAERGNGSSSVAAALMMAFTSFHHGDVELFDELFPPLAEIADQLKDTDIADVDLFLQLVGMVYVYSEQWDTGRAYLSNVAHRAGRRARSATAALATATLAELCWRSGRWEEAWSLATSELVCEVTLTGARLWLMAFTAHLDAGFGRWEDCARRAHAAIAEAEPMGFGTAVMWAYHGLGLLELGQGHAVAAASYLDHIDAMATALEIVEPGGVWWQGDHIEALIRSGRPHEAARALARFESASALSQRQWALATVARCHAMMAVNADDAEMWFEKSLAHHDQLVAPFELARTLLCRCERRVALGSQLNPSADLAEAIAIFDSLGAVPWSAQGRSLMATVASSDEPRAEELLSPAERRVAEAVVAGLTNREVATSLFVSEKTVEFHLHNVFGKLDVRSRTQLVRRMA